ncbi:MAG: YybH family protein [Deltaproteobacteria bacterium]
MTDREAIEELRRRDVAASKAQDAEQLAALWTEDCIALPPGLPPARGKAVIRAQLARMLEYQRDVEVVEYEEVFEELEILGDTAIEWGWIRGAERPRAGGEVRRSQVKVMRVLKRQPDGTWLVHRSMFNS